MADNGLYVGYAPRPGLIMGFMFPARSVTTSMMLGDVLVPTRPRRGPVGRIRPGPRAEEARGTARRRCLSWTSGVSFVNLCVQAPETGVAGPTNSPQSALTGGDGHGKRPFR